MPGTFVECNRSKYFYVLLSVGRGLKAQIKDDILIAIADVYFHMLCTGHKGGNMMKRINWLLPVFLFLFLFCACGGSGQEGTSSGGLQETQTKQEASVKTDLPEVDTSIAYDSVVEISINPLFWVYLDKEIRVISIEAKNEDAEKVCSDINPVGKTFDEAFGELLMETFDKGYLSNDKKVEVSVLTMAEGTDTYAPDIVQHTGEIIDDTAIVCNVNLQAEVVMAQQVIEKQSYRWSEKDREMFGEAVSEDYDAVGSSGEGNMENSEGASREEGTGKPVEGQDRNPEENSGEHPAGPELEKCDSCNGTGISKCHGCKGEGSLPCEECGGKGVLSPVCEDCKNTGYVVCTLCEGAGSLSSDAVSGEDGDDVCDLCGGDARLEGKCPYCGGTGKCVNCHGSGQELDERGESKPCHTCGGNGLHTNIFYGVTMPCYGAMPCNRCNGTGKKNNGGNNGQPSVCNRCDGSGKEKCVNNVHNGPVDCPACDAGTAICGNCNGTGEWPCQVCDGDGIKERK